MSGLGHVVLVRTVYSCVPPGVINLMSLGEWGVLRHYEWVWHIVIDSSDNNVHNIDYNIDYNYTKNDCGDNYHNNYDNYNYFNNSNNFLEFKSSN